MQMINSDNNMQEGELERFNSTEEPTLQDFYSQNQEESKGKAIPFVEVNEADELEISAEAMTLLN